MRKRDSEVPQWKIDEVRSLAQSIKKSKMVGIVQVEGIKTKQLQGIRNSLRGKAIIRKARNTLMVRALKESRVKEIDEMVPYIRGSVAFIFSEQDPYSLGKFLSENKTYAPAKGGQVSPKDIVVPAMNTGVAPGPFISELAALKIPARVKGGVIHVTEDTVVVRAGEVISNAMAQMLSRLKIEPMEVRLNLIAAFADGTLLTSKDLQIDLHAIFEEVLSAHKDALNLAVNIVYITPETVTLILTKADMEAKSLALNVGFFEPELVLQFIAKANAESFTLVVLLAEKNPEAVPSEIIAQARAQTEFTATSHTPSTDVKKAEEEKEEKKEEESVTGLAGLFG